MFSFFGSREDKDKDDDKAYDNDDVATNETGDVVSSSMEESSSDAAAMAPVAMAVAVAVSGVSPPPQTPPKVSVPESVPESVPARTWQDLHRATCLRHHSLVATAAQVQAYHHDTQHNDVDLSLALPVRTSVLLGKDPDLQEKLVQQFQAHEQSFASPRKGVASASVTAAALSNRKSVWYTAAAATTYAVATTTAHVLTSPLRLVNRIALSQIEGDGYDDVPSGWEEEAEEQERQQERAHEHQHAHHSASIDSVIDLQETVFHTDLALECWRLLQNAAARSPDRILRLEASASSSSSFNNNNNNDSDKQYSWHGWLQHVATTAAADAAADADAAHPKADAANLLLNLPESQTNLLLHCLVAANSDRFQIVRREDASDVVVFGTKPKQQQQQPKNDKDQTTKPAESSSLQTRLTLHDLEYAVSQVQQRIDVTLEKRDISTRRALAAQKIQKNTKLALAEMKRRKLHDQSLDNAYAALEKLEQVRLTVQTAVHQRDELQMMLQATEALHAMRRHPPEGEGGEDSSDFDLEMVDGVLDDWREEQEHVKRVSDTLAAAMLPGGDDNGGDDDDELMKELEALTLGDKNDQELMNELGALTLGDKNGKKAKEEGEAKADGSTGMPTKEISKNKSDEEEETPKAEVPSSPIPVAL